MNGSLQLNFLKLIPNEIGLQTCKFLRKSIMGNFFVEQIGFKKFAILSKRLHNRGPLLSLWLPIAYLTLSEVTRVARLFGQKAVIQWSKNVQDDQV